MASRGDSPTLFAGQPWSAYYESLAVGGVDEAKDGPPLPDVDAAGNGGGSMKLRKDDIKIFGVCPSLDEFYLTVCEYCGAVIKPQALMGHIEGRHKGSTNDVKPLEHLATNKEPPLKRSHKSKGKLNDKVAPQSLMNKYVLPKAPPNCHPNGKPKSALAEQLSKAHPPRLSKQPSDSASAAVAAGQLSAAARKLLPPQPPPPVASPRLLLPPPPLPSPLPHTAPPTETPQLKAPSGQAAGVQQSAIVTSSTSAAGHRKDGNSTRDSPSPRIAVSSAKQPSPLPSVSSSGAIALPQPSAAAVAAASATAAATAAAAAVAALASSCSERHEVPKSMSNRPETLLTASVRPLECSKISGEMRSTCGAAVRADSTPCPTAAVWAETSVTSRRDAVGSESSPFAGGESFCGSASRASESAAAGKLTELASADDSRSDAVLEPSGIAVAGCTAIEDSKGCKRSPESVSPLPFKKPCRLSSMPAAASASRLLPCKDREYDPDKHCGVFIDEVHKNCTRSLTCKTHALSLRRKVCGRSKPFDQLLKEHREAKEAALLSKQKSGSPLPQHSLHLGRAARTPPSLSSSSSHSPRSTSGSVDAIDAIRLTIGVDSASGGASLSQHRQPTLPEGYLSHHPRPLAVNTFGVRLNGYTYLLNRKADLLRSAVQATLEQRQLHLVNPARKIAQAKGSSSSIIKDSPGCVTGSAALDAPSNGLASSKTSASLTGSVAHGVPVLAAAATSNSRMAVLSPALRGVSLPLSGQAIAASAQSDGPAAKRAKMSDPPTVTSSVGTTAVVGQQSMQTAAQLTASGGTVAQPNLSGNTVVVGNPGIPASRPLLATLAARQQQQQMLQQQQQLLSDTSLSSISGAGTSSTSSVTPTITATLLALGGAGGGAATVAGGLMKFGSQAVPSASSLSNVSSKAPAAVTVGTSVGSGSAGAANAVLVTDASASGIEKGGSVGVSPTTFLLTSCGTADNVRMKGALVNGSIQMTTNASPIGALSHRAASGTTAIAATLLAPAHSAADSTTIGLALSSTSVPNVIFRKTDSFNAVTQSSSVGGSVSASASSASGLQLSAVANQRHVGVNTAAAGQTAAIGTLVGTGSALMAGQHVLQQPAAGVTGGTASSYPVHISSSSLKGLPHQATIRLLNATQPHQTLRQQQQLPPAVSLSIPLVGNPQPQTPSQQQQSAVHKAAAAQSSLSNLRV